jgi:hypothetical protein
LVVSISVLVLSSIASTLIGLAAGPLATVTKGSFSFYANTGSSNPAIVALAIFIFLHIGSGTLLGVWGLTQGIVAVAQNRGRAQGIVAIVIAALAPIISLVVYFVAIMTSLPRS